MQITDTYRPLEIGVWRNGVAMTTLYNHPWDFKAGSYHQFRVAGNSGSEDYDVRIETREPMVDGWVSARMWLSDWYGNMIGPVAPTLIYTEPTDLPMTTAFPCTWVDAPKMAGLWVVSTRVTQPAIPLDQIGVGD